MAISIDGPTSLSTSEDHKKRFAAAGWHVQAVDGLDPDAVNARHPQGAQCHRQALADRLQDGDRLRRADQAGTAATHGSPLGKDEVLGARQKLGWNYPPFDIPEPIFFSLGARSARAASRPGANGPSAMPP